MAYHNYRNVTGGAKGDTKMPAPSPCIWESLAHPEDYDDSCKQRQAENPIDPNAELPFEETEIPEPITFDVARGYCYPEFLWKKPFYTDRGVAISRNGHHANTIFKRVTVQLRNSEYKGEYRPHATNYYKTWKNKDKWLVESMTKKVHDNPPKLSWHSDWDENYFDEALTRDAQPYVQLDRRKKVRKTARETVDDDLVTAECAETIIQDRNRRIQALQDDLDQARRLASIRITNGSDPSSPLPEFHEAMLLYRHTSRNLRDCHRCVTGQKAPVRTGHFSNPVPYHKNKPVKFGDYH